MLDDLAGRGHCLETRIETNDAIINLILMYMWDTLSKFSLPIWLFLGVYPLSLQRSSGTIVSNT